MFDINGFELLIILLLAIILVGPDRLPEYVSGLRSVVKRVRSLLTEGRTALRDEFGEDLDWSQYDPRQYDPRRIVREALLEDDDEVAASPRRQRRASSGGTPSVPVSVAVAASTADVAVAEDPDATPMLGTPVVPGAPFDPEST